MDGEIRRRGMNYLGLLLGYPSGTYDLNGEFSLWQKAEKARMNEEVFAQWIAKKKAQKAAEKHQREREAEAKKHEEESKRQQKAEAAKVGKS